MLKKLNAERFYLFLGFPLHFLKIFRALLPDEINTFEPNIQDMEKVAVFTDKQVQLARFAKALGHPVRIYILQLLDQQTCCYSGDLSDILPIAKSTLSQHLSELKEAGLIQGEIQAPKIKYCLNKKNWQTAKELFGEMFAK